jgi:YebC/PmpR family DNA-binding regulatory protein
MSGHNKWSKIKHKKAASDAERSKLFSKHSSLITMEARRSGGDLGSPGLAAAIERAKKDAMPKENIDRAITKGAGGTGATLEEVVFEAYGPGGVALIITAITDNNNRTNQEIKHTLSKRGYELGAPGSALWAFHKRPSGGYAPSNSLAINDETGEQLAELVEALSSHDEVQDIFTTADEPDTN